MAMENFTVGIIGMGDMGKMYARRISAAGWRYVSRYNCHKLQWQHTVSVHNIILCVGVQVHDDLSAFGSSMACREASVMLF